MDYLEVKHLLGAPYHQQSQGIVAVFNRTRQREFSKAYINTKKDENEKFEIELNLHPFLHYYN